MSRLLKHDGRKAHCGVCAAGYALQADRRVNGCVRTGRFRLRRELLRQIAVPMEGVDFAP